MGNIKRNEYFSYDVFFDGNGQKHTVLVYGEIKSQKISSLSPYKFLKKRTLKSLNIGWAICSEEDEFDLDTGIKLAKKRLYKNLGDLFSFNRNFLTDDMVNAILKNEVNYIKSHIEKYISK